MIINGTHTRTSPKSRLLTRTSPKSRLLTRTAQKRNWFGCADAAAETQQAGVDRPRCEQEGWALHCVTSVCRNGRISARAPCLLCVRRKRSPGHTGEHTVFGATLRANSAAGACCAAVLRLSCCEVCCRPHQSATAPPRDAATSAPNPATATAQRACMSARTCSLHVTHM